MKFDPEATLDTTQVEDARPKPIQPVKLTWLNIIKAVMKGKK
jgi:hypothetical protein